MAKDQEQEMEPFWGGHLLKKLIEGSIIPKDTRRVVLTIDQDEFVQADVTLMVRDTEATAEVLKGVLFRPIPQEEKK